MKIRVDRAVCQGHALCYSISPELFTLDDEGYSNVDVREVPPGMEEIARRGVLSCPELAITIEDDQPDGPGAAGAPSSPR